MNTEQGTTDETPKKSMVRTEFLTEVRNEYVSMLNLAMGIIEVGKTTPEHSEFGSLPLGFVYKQCLHGYTVWSIVQPVHRAELVMLDDDAVMFDFASLAHVVRAMFELDVTMRYLFLDANTEAERTFRIEMWTLHGMCRQRAGAEALQFEPDEQSEKLESKIVEQIALIRRLPHYRAMTNKARTDQKLNNNARQYGKYFERSEDIMTLGKRLGYDERMVDSMYIHASAYTHTNALSLMQLMGEADNTRKFLRCDYMLEYAKIILTKTIKNFMECDVKLNKNYPHVRKEADS